MKKVKSKKKILGKLILGQKICIRYSEFVAGFGD